MATVTLKNNLHKGSAWLATAMWSLFFSLAFLVVASCGGDRESEQLAVLSNEIDMMKSSQRKSDNTDFYIHKYNADKIIDHYKDDLSAFSDDNKQLYANLRGHYFFILSDYLLQTGNRREAIKILDELSSSHILNLNADTAMWLTYLSHQGQIRYIPYHIEEHRSDIEKGYDCLMQCYILSSRCNIPLFKGIAMQLLSDYMLNDSIHQLVNQFDPSSLRYINEEGVPDSLLAGNLAQRSLNILLEHNNVYFTANAWRKLANCYFKVGDINSSIQCLNNAIAIPVLDSIPDLKASILEQLSMSYSGVGDKYLSDLYRNQYLDIQDYTRVDRAMEAKLISLNEEADIAWRGVFILLGVFVLLCIVIGLLYMLRRRYEKKSAQEDDEVMELQENIQRISLQQSESQRVMVEQRARIYILENMMSLIERLRISVKRGDMQYASEIASSIDEQNNMLTQWIKLQKGRIAPHIENVDMEEIFSIVRKNSLADSKIHLHVEPSTATVKADRALTLFLVNTLVDNARKSISGEGEITVECHTTPEYAEVSVSDTGCGIPAEQLPHIFERKPIKDSHGFGLQNCRGIIDSYKKISSIFRVCSIEAMSKVGEGTTIRFRLPLSVRTLCVALMAMLTMSMSAADVSVYADSLYNLNVQGDYQRAMLYSDSCMIGVRNGETVSNALKLTIYNETAVASLALHQWKKYKYYNYLYTELYKEVTSDNLLAGKCDHVQLMKQYARYAHNALLVLLVLLLPVAWYFVIHPFLKRKHGVLRLKSSLEEEQRMKQREYSIIHVQNNIVNNHLSAIKHETMYYPSRIKQMIGMDDWREQQASIASTCEYYSQLYNALLAPLLAGDQQYFPVRRQSLGTFFRDLQVGEDDTVVANEEMLRYLLLLLKRHNAGHAPVPSVVHGNAEGKSPDRFVTLTFPMDRGELSSLADRYGADALHAIFSSHPSLDISNTDYLIMRQIIREIANSASSYLCGIKAEMRSGIPVIVITLPR